MASPVLHIKDAYFFEVPKILWPSHRASRADFPDVWIRLDPDFQLWEAERLLGERAALRTEIGDVPPWPELRAAYLEWNHDHANFGRPFDAMLEEAHAATQRQYAAAHPDQPVAEGQAFQGWLAATRPPYAWFSRWRSQPQAAAEWATATQAAGDLAAYDHPWQAEKIEAYNGHLSGKILIPQPFGELRNLHEPGSGFCISKFMVIEVAVALVLLAAFAWLGKKAVAGGPPRGRLWNLLEVFLEYLRDKVARPSIGEHDGDRFVPLLWTIFLFILGCNLCGLLPWVGAPTSSLGVTSGLAAVTFATGVVCGVRRFGPLGFFLNQVPPMKLPFPLGLIIKPMILAIELLGLCIKHGVLAVRLLANMAAGHLVLVGIMGLAFGASAAFSFATAPSWQWWLTAAISVIASTLFSCLELFVAFLQAYVFTFLSALFIGAAIHHH